MKRSIKIAELLLRIGCLQVRTDPPFTYASGLKGPIYCDNRQVFSFVSEREEICRAFVELIKEQDFKFDYIAGLATAGIPHAALIANELKSPMVYIRSSPKSHGKNNVIEGHFTKGSKLLLIEDLVNQASSLEKAVMASRAKGVEVVGCLSVVDYQTQASKDVLKRLGISLFSLTHFDVIANTALEKNIIDKSDYERLFAWQKKPELWS